MKKRLGMFLLLIIASFFSLASVKAEATLKVNPSKVNVSVAGKDYTFQLIFSGATGTSWKLSYDSDIYPTGTNPIRNGKLSSENGTILFAVKKDLNIHVLLLSLLENLLFLMELMVKRLILQVCYMI